jgi:hypothetical protein
MLSDIMRMALLNDYQSVFLKAAFNSILPEFMDSDVIDNDNVSPEFIGVLRKVADHYYASEEVTQSHLANADEGRARMLRAGAIDYDMLSDLFDADLLNFLEARNVTNTLGRFTITPNGDGSYEIFDTYDFQNNKKYLDEFAPEISGAMRDMGFEDSSIAQLLVGARLSVEQRSAQPLGEMIGGLFMSDSTSPEEGGSQYVRLSIPAEDKVDNVRPSPRPTWFEDENVEPVFPSTPMDDERKGLFDMAMDSIFSPAEAQESTQ